MTIWHNLDWLHLALAIFALICACQWGGAEASLRQERGVTEFWRNRADHWYRRLKGYPERVD